MDPLEASEAIADQILPLAERLLANHKPGAILEEQPEFHEIQALLKQAEQLLRGGLDDALGQLKTQAQQTHEKAADLRAKQQAALQPQPAPPPLLALPFEAKYTPPVAERIAELLQLPAKVLESGRTAAP